VLKDLPSVQLFSKDINLGKHWQLWMGSFIVLVIIFAPRGLMGLAERFLHKKAGSK
jgi:branched-chain amino acid transport system permease protein